eukprot:3605586-Prymnesium_polylepis.1
MARRNTCAVPSWWNTALSQACTLNVVSVASSSGLVASTGTNSIGWELVASIVANSRWSSPLWKWKQSAPSKRITSEWDRATLPPLKAMTAPELEALEFTIELPSVSMRSPVFIQMAPP